MDLSELRDSARSKADEQSSGFISNVELKRFLNQGLRIVYGKIVQNFEDFFIVKGTSSNDGLIEVTANGNEYDLPSNLLKLVRVERRNTNDSNENNWRKLMRLNIGNDQINDFFPIREGRDQGFGYFIAGDKIYLRPVPSGGFDMRLWFIPKVTAMSASTDTPGVPEEYHELIAEYGAIQCLAKSGEGIWKERMDTFNLELANMFETIQHRVHEPQQMIVSDDTEFDKWSQ